MMNRKDNPENFTPDGKFAKGNTCGKGYGRPFRKASITEIARKMQGQPPDPWLLEYIKHRRHPLSDDMALLQAILEHSSTWEEAQAKRMQIDAVMGKNNELITRLEGKVPQPVQGEHIGTVTLRVVYVNRKGIADNTT